LQDTVCPAFFIFTRLKGSLAFIMNIFKKQTLFIVSVLSAAFISVSCASAGSQMPLMVPETTGEFSDPQETAVGSVYEESAAENTAETDVSYEVTEAETVPEPAEVTKAAYENKNAVFKAGTWFGYSKESSKYYFFYNDNANGARMMPEKGVLSPFLYEIPAEAGEKNIRNGVFHFNTADNTTKAEITMTDPENALIKWEDGKTEKLSFVSTEGIGNFTLYTDEELGTMALSYYKKSKGDTYKMNKAECVTNEDRTVSVCIYKIVHTDTKAVLAWYIVDRHTAVGFESEDGKKPSSVAVDFK